MKLENSKVLVSLEGILILRYFLAFLSDLNFCVNINLQRLFKKRMKTLNPIFEQIRTNTKRTIKLSKSLIFNQLQKQLINHLVSLYYLTLTHSRDIITETETFDKFLNSLSLDILARNYALKSEFSINTAYMCNKSVATDTLCATLSGDTDEGTYKWRTISELQTHLIKINAHVCNGVSSLRSLDCRQFLDILNMYTELHTYFISSVVIGNQYSGEFPFRLSFMTTITKEVKQ